MTTRNNVRQDFITAYTSVWACAPQFADGLLRQVETDYADQENRQLQSHVDQAAVEHMQSQEVQSLRQRVNEWKSWETEARGALVQITILLGREDLAPLLQAGCYEQVVALLREQRQEEKK